MYTLVFETKSIIKMQHHYRTQYAKDQPSDNAILCSLQHFEETGNILRLKRSRKFECFTGRY
jgi:hypothetical protein